MHDIFDKLHKVNEASEDTYEMDVDLVVLGDGFGDELPQYPDKIHMEYSIIVEFRSWGIKDISVIPRKADSFEVEVTDIEDNVVDTLNVELDFDQFPQVSWVPGAGFAPESLEVGVKRDGTVSGIDFNFYYASH